MRRKWRISGTFFLKWMNVSIGKAAVLLALLVMASCATLKHSPVLVPPVLRSAVTPAYPPVALAGKHGGIAVVKVRVEADGSVSDASVVKSAGFVELDKAALLAAYGSHFKPGTSDGIATAGTTRIPIAFFPAKYAGQEVTICQALPVSAPDDASQVELKDARISGDQKEDPLRRIFATLVTAGCGAASLSVDWSYQGTLVNETTIHIEEYQPSVTVMKLSNPDKWPLGQYRADVKVNGQLSASKVFFIGKEGLSIGN